MRVYAIQSDIAWEDKAANYARARGLLEQVDLEPGALIVLPEMFATGFSFRTEITAEPEGGETEQFLAALATERGACVVGGVVTGREGSSSNEAVAFAPGGELLVRYAKIHPFSGAGEDQAHNSGNEVRTFQWGAFVVAPFVCYDLRFPEIFRAATRKGANLFVVIANWPVKRQEHWLTLLRARAIENQAYVVGVNRTGNDPRFAYAGRSVIVSPHGVIIGDAGEEERVLEATIDPELMEAWRREFPAVRDMHWLDVNTD